MMRVGTNETELIAIMREVVSLIGEGRVEDAVDCLFVVDKEKVCSLIRLGIATDGSYDSTFLDDPDWNWQPHLAPITPANEAVFYRVSRIFLEDEWMQGSEPRDFSGISASHHESNLYAGIITTWLMMAEDCSDLAIEFWIRRVPGGLALEYDLVKR